LKIIKTHLFFIIYQYSKLKFTYAFTQEISKFQILKNGMHQVGPNCNFPKIFSSLALKGEAVGVAQISPYGGGGT
jgi:hypothetical protein